MGLFDFLKDWKPKIKPEWKKQGFVDEDEFLEENFFGLPRLTQYEITHINIISLNIGDINGAVIKSTFLPCLLYTSDAADE